MRFAALLFILLLAALRPRIGTCQGNSSSVVVREPTPGSPPYQAKHGDAIKGNTSVFACLLHCCWLIPLFCCDWFSHNIYWAAPICLIGWFLALIGLITFFALFYGEMWNDYIKIFFWSKYDFTVVSTVTANYTCSRKSCYGCESAPGGAQSCGVMYSTNTKGSCDNGYYCCATYQVCTSCGKDCKSCRTECLIWVNHQHCEIFVGTCYKVQSFVTYVPDSMDRDVTGHSLVYGTLYTQSCGFNDIDCVRRTQAKYVPGYTFQAAINPADPQDIDENPHYATKDKVGLGFAIALIVIGYIMIFTAVARTLLNEWDTGCMPSISCSSCRSVGCPDISCLCCTCCDPKPTITLVLPYASEPQQSVAVNPTFAGSNPSAGGYPSAPPAYDSIAQTTGEQQQQGGLPVYSGPPLASDKPKETYT